MKVLIIRNAFTYDFGGAERLAVHLAQELSRQGIQTRIISRQPRMLDYAKELNVPASRGWWWSQQNWSGIRSIGFPIYLSWQFVLFCWYMGAFIRYKPDAVHILSKDDFVAATFAARLQGKAVVWTDTADLKYVFANHRIWYKNPVGKLVYSAGRLAQSILLVSESERRLITEQVGHDLPENLRVVHIAGRDEKVIAMKREPKDKDAVIFCSTSRLVIAKGIKELIVAFREISTVNPDAYRLWIVGEGPDKEQFIKLANADPSINFIGHSDQPLAYVAACDVFVHPSYHEGFSLSLTEAAMLGKPMVATNVGGNPELVNAENGILVPAFSSAELVQAMRKLGNDAELRRELGQNARRDYISKFDFSMVVKTAIIPIYENR